MIQYVTVKFNVKYWWNFRYKEKYPDLKEGNSYEVEYWQENPERAIMHLNKPVEN